MFAINCIGSKMSPLLHVPKHTMKMHRNNHVDTCLLVTTECKNHPMAQGFQLIISSWHQRNEWKWSDDLKDNKIEQILSDNQVANSRWCQMHSNWRKQEKVKRVSQSTTHVNQVQNHNRKLNCPHPRCTSWQMIQTQHLKLSVFETKWSCAIIIWTTLWICKNQSWELNHCCPFPCCLNSQICLKTFNAGFIHLCVSSPPKCSIGHHKQIES